MRVSAFIATVALVLLSPPGTASALSLLSQTRDVDAYAALTPFFQAPIVDEHTESAPDFGPFAGAVTATMSGPGRTDSSATQDSSIAAGSGDSLDTSASGRVEAGAFHNNRGADDFASRGSSSYLLTFEVTSDEAYELVAMATVVTSSSGSADASATTRIELVRDGGEVIEQLLLTAPAGGSDSDAFDHSGVLTPATYSLRVDSSATGGAFRNLSPGAPSSNADGHVDYDVTLRLLPEPGALALLSLALLALWISRPGQALSGG